MPEEIALFGTTRAERKRRGRPPGSKTRANTTAKAIGYGRMSTLKQETSLDVQQTQVTGYFEWCLRPEGVAWGGFFTDPAISGTIPFRDRETGAKVFSSLMPGDHLLVGRFDRAFRNALDAFQTLHDLRKRKITVHLIDKRIDTGTSTGRMFCQILAIFSEWERNWISERTKDGLRQKKTEPGYCNNKGTPPLGFDIVKDPHKKRANGKPYWVHVPDLNEMKLMRQIWRLVRNGESMSDIARKLNNLGVVKKFRNSLGKGTAWKVDSVYLYDLRYRQLMEARKLPEEALPLPEELVLS